MVYNHICITPIRDKQGLFFCLKIVSTKVQKEDYFFVYLLLITKQITIRQSSMKLISKVTGSYMPIKVIFHNHFLPPSSIGEFTSSREYALI